MESQGLYKRKAGLLNGEGEISRYYTTVFEDVERAHEPRNAGCF